MLQSPKYEQWMLYGTTNDEFYFKRNLDNETQDASSDTEITLDSESKRQKHGNRLFHIYEKERLGGELECANMSNRYS